MQAFSADSGCVLSSQCTAHVGTFSSAGLSHPQSQKPCYNGTAIRGPAPRRAGEDAAKGGAGVVPASPTAALQAERCSSCSVMLSQGKDF